MLPSSQMRRFILITWLLLVPPNTYNNVWGTGKVIDVDSPKAEWILIGDFATEEECKATIEQNKIIMALTGNGDMAQRFNHGHCMKK
jgi:hypothetical protein